MNDQAKFLSRIVQVNHDLVDQRAGDLLFQCHRAGGITPNRREVLTQRQDGCFIGTAERGSGLAVCVKFALQLFQCFEFDIPALLEHLRHQTIGGVDLVILIKRPLGFILLLLVLAL